LDSPTRFRKNFLFRQVLLGPAYSRARRHSGWIWLVHLINDVVIFSLIALTTARWV
jgi:hypothetical protein